MFTTVVEKPAKRQGIFLARTYVSWWGAALFVWVVVQSIVLQLELQGKLNGLPVLLPGFLTATLLFAAFVLLFNLAYWGAPLKASALAKTDYEAEYDRFVRAFGDQYLSSMVLAATGWTLLWLLVYYSDHGLLTFAPLPAVSTGGTTQMHFVLIKIFGLMAVMGVGGAAMVAVLFTYSDLFKRMALAAYREKQALVARPPFTGLENDA